jgi:hypothetical protein
LALHYIRENETITKEREGDVVVVSPTLYWYAHAEFPTKSLSKARKLADAYLDSRPDSYTTIHVEKRGGGFDCYAYDAAALRTRLEAADAADAPAYFLQQLAAEMPLRIDEKLTADIINGICIELPDTERTLPSIESVDFEASATSFNRANSGTVPNRLLAALVALLAVTMLFDLSLRFQTYRAVTNAAERDSVEKSLYELKSLVSRYEKTAAEQKRLRQSIQKALKQGGLKKLVCTPSKGCSRE